MLNAAAIEALVPLVIFFRPRLRPRVAMALRNAGELLREADAGQLDAAGAAGTPLPAASVSSPS